MRQEKPENTIKQPPKLKEFLCNVIHGGCGSIVLEQGYHKSGMVCGPCATRIASQNGFQYDSVNYAIINQSTLNWYDRKFPGFGNLEYREQVRILAHACGCEGIQGLTERERGGGIKIRLGVPDIYRPSFRDEPMKIVKQIETLTEGW